MQQIILLLNRKFEKELTKGLKKVNKELTIALNTKKKKDVL